MTNAVTVSPSCRLVHYKNVDIISDGLLNPALNPTAKG